MKTPFTFSPYPVTNRRGSSSTIVVSNLSLLKILLVALFTGLLLFTQPSSTHAQTLSLSLWPPLLEAQLQPGQTITQTYRLKNQGDDTLITANLLPFEPADDLGHVQLTLQGYQSPALSYFQLNHQSLPLTFPLKAGEIKELSLTLTIPSTANLTDHYLTLLFQANTQGLITGSGSRTLGAVGSNILLTISPPNPPQPTAVIKAFSISKSSKPSDILRLRTLNILDSFDPFNFTLQVTNPSPSFLKAIGHIDIHNSFNQTTTLPLRSDNILAHSSRQLIPEKPWNPLFPFGRYTATATITPQNTTHTISQTTSFWIIPYKALLVLVLIFLIYRCPTLAKYIKKYQPRLPKFLQF